MLRLRNSEEGATDYMVVIAVSILKAIQATSPALLHKGKLQPVQLAYKTVLRKQCW